MIFKQKDGELRIHSGSTNRYYIEVLFTNADLNFPIGRPTVEEVLNLDRGNYDSNASYSEGSDMVVLEPLPITVSAKLDDQTQSSYLRDWLSGVTVINSKTLTSTKASSSVSINQTTVTTKAFADGGKIAYDMEVLYDATASGTTNKGWTLNEVYFPPDQQTVAEGEDNVTLNMNGVIYGDISSVSKFPTSVNITA